MRIEELLRDGAARHGTTAAIVAGKGRHTYAELDVKSDRLAAALQSRGVKRGDRVVAFLDAGWASLVALFAVLKAGALFNPVDPSTSPDELVRVLEQSGAVGIVTESRLASVTGAALVAAPSVRLVVLAGGDRMPATETCLSFEEVVGRIGTPPQLQPAGADIDPAVAFGEDLPLTHRDIVAAAVAAERDMGAVAALPPCAGIGGLHHMLAAIAAGATLVLKTRFERMGGLTPAVAGRWAAGYAGSGSGAFDSVSVG